MPCRLAPVIGAALSLKQLHVVCEESLSAIQLTYKSTVVFVKAYNLKIKPFRSLITALIPRGERGKTVFLWFLY